MTPASATDRRGFHLNKGISLEAIIAFVMLLIGGLTYIFHQDGRTTRNEEAIAYLKEQNRQFRDDIISRLDRIENKVDSNTNTGPRGR